MPTDEERREMARRLRGNPGDTLIPHRTGRHHGMGCREAADRFWNMCDRIKAAGNYDIAFSTTSVLADLIEPSDEPNGELPERLRTFADNDERSGCDSDALLALADEMERNADTLGSDYGVAVHVLRKHAEAVRRAVGA